MACSHAVPARAQVSEIFKCVDPGSGRPLYTSDKRDTVGKKCQMVSREVNVMPATRPSTFPRESSRDRAGSRDRKHEILQQELATEQEALSRAKKNLADQEAARSGDEKNYAKVLERLQPFKESVESHEKNIAALRRELANLR
jgi:hypothetical protein